MKTIIPIALSAAALWGQPAVVRSSLGPTTTANGISVTATAGTGGVTAKLLAGKDAGNPSAYIIPASGGCGSGIAATTVAAAATFELYVVPGAILTGVADNTVTAGHILVGGTTTPGRVKDSGQTLRTAIDSQTCIVGVAQASAATAGDVLLRYDGSGTYGALGTATPVPAPGTTITLTAPRGYAVCTGTCTVTVPVPAAGYEFCVLNDDNVATAITLSALGSSAMYESTARTAYGTAGTGTLAATAAAGNKICIVGRDATHYLTLSFVGTWTAN